MTADDAVRPATAGAVRISVITLATCDQQRASDFYRTWLERDPHRDRSGVVYFALDGCSLALFPRTELARYCGVEPAGHGFDGVTVSVNVASTGQVAALVERARRAGATIVREPGTAHWGGRIAWLADPDGHLWELVFNPAGAGTAG